MGVEIAYLVAWTVWGWHPSGGKMFFFSSRRPYRPWGPPSLLFEGYRGSLPGVKWPSHGADNSHQSSVEVKNEWRCTSAPYMPSWSGQGQLYLLLHLFCTDFTFIKDLIRVISHNYQTRSCSWFWFVFMLVSHYTSSELNCGNGR